MSDANCEWFTDRAFGYQPTHCSMGCRTRKVVVHGEDNPSALGRRQHFLPMGDAERQRLFAQDVLDVDCRSEDLFVVLFVRATYVYRIDIVTFQQVLEVVDRDRNVLSISEGRCPFLARTLYADNGVTVLR